MRTPALLLFLATSSTLAGAQSIEILSRPTGGGSANGESQGAPVLSVDGRHVVFSTWATNLAPGGSSLRVVALDRNTQTFECISVGTGGTGSWTNAQVGGVSDDGRYVTFLATDFVPGGSNDYGTDVLVRDRVANTTTELTGFEFEGLDKGLPQISANGQDVCWRWSNDWHSPAFHAISIRTVTGGIVADLYPVTNDVSFGSSVLASGGRFVAYGHTDAAGYHVSRWDYTTGAIVPIVSMPWGPGPGAVAAGISRDGRFVAYVITPSSGSELWLRDMETATSERIDVPNSGVGFALSRASISDDGRHVVWATLAATYVPGDTNMWSDVFVRDRVAQATARASVSLAGAQANGASQFPVLDMAGNAVVFLSAASNLTPSDTNGFDDVYRRSLCTLTWADADGDSYGAGASLFSCAPPPANHVGSDGDCNDANPAVHPGATEVCNGIDDDCDAAVDEDVAGVAFCFGDGSGEPCPCGNSGAAGNGCASSVNPNGARLATLGCASLSNDTLVLAGSGMSDSFALYFQGDAQLGGGSGVPFGDGLRCVGGTIARLGTRQNSGGASQYPEVGDPPVSVQGSVTAPGARHYQSWYRNAAAFCTSATFNLTNGVAVTWTP